MQGANVYQGLQGLKGNKEMLDKLRMAKERMTSDNQMTLGD
jgi:hypothetical protein